MSRSRSSAKKAGTQFETDVSEYLKKRLGKPILRMPKSGSVDKGDIAGVQKAGKDVAIECKSPGRNSPLQLPKWAKETETEAKNLGTKYGILLIKRYREKICNSYAIFSYPLACDFFGIIPVEAFDHYEKQNYDLWPEHLEKSQIFTTPRRGGGKWVITTLDYICDFLDNSNQSLLSPTQKKRLKVGSTVTLQVNDVTVTISPQENGEVTITGKGIIE